MQFGFLGPLEAHGDDGAVTIGSRLQRRLLAVLLVHAGSVVPADRLVDLLWGDRPPVDARQALWSCVARLRRSLADQAGGPVDELLATRPPGYLLTAGSDQIDASQFEHLASVASQIAANRPDEAADLLDRALGLWRGPALQEFVDEPFAMVEATRLDEMRLTAMEDRFEIDLTRGEHAALVAPLGAFTADHPMRERARSQLMLALHRSSRQPEALECYRDYRQHLNDELGLEPSAALSALQTQILQQAPELDWQGLPPVEVRTVDTRAVSQPAAGSGPRLPAELTSFLGRTSDVRAIIADLDEARLVTVTGLGGIGKTRLALRVTTLASSRFVDGAFWCELAPIADPTSVAAALATSLGVRGAAELTVVDSVVAFLSDKQVLLVLDNCEHVLSSVRSMVTTLLNSCPGLVILATSRERLAIDGERTRLVAPLPLPPARGAEPDNPAVSLFIDRARAVRPDLRLGRQNLADIADICRALDGLPLAIELAAARVRSLNPTDLAARMRDRLDLLSSPGSASDRHGTLRAVLDWSHGLLLPEQRRLFSRLSVFAGTFDLTAAEAVCSGRGIERRRVLDLLASLVEASMVNIGATDGTVRYSLLETVRHYAAEHLDEMEAAAARRAHAHHYAHVAGRADAGLRGADEARWVTTVDSELDNFRSAHRWMVDGSEVDLAMRLARGLRYYMLFRFRDEVVAWGEASLALPAAERHEMFVEVCGAVGEGLTARGEMQAALKLADRGLSGLTQVDDARRMYALRVEGMVALYAGRLDDGFREHGEMLRLARLHDHPYEEGMALLGLAQSCTYAGHPDRGLAFADEQLRVAVSLRNPSMLSLAWYDRAEALSTLDPAQALESYQRAVHLAEAAGSSFVEGIALVGLASLLGRSQDPQVALPVFRSIIARWRRMNVWHHQWTTLRNLVQLFVRTESWETATVLLGAIDARSTATAPFGNDAADMDTAATRLNEVLGTTRWHAARALGAAMSREEVVTFACQAIDAART